MALRSMLTGSIIYPHKSFVTILCDINGLENTLLSFNQS